MDEDRWVEEINILFDQVSSYSALTLKKIYEGLPTREVQIGVVITLLWAHFLVSDFDKLRQQYRYVWDNVIFNSDRKNFYTILVDVLFHVMRNTSGKVYNPSRAMDLTLAGDISIQSPSDRFRQTYDRIEYLLKSQNRKQVRDYDDDGDRDAKKLRQRPTAPATPVLQSSEYGLPTLKAPVGETKSMRMTAMNGIAEPGGSGWFIT